MLGVPPRREVCCHLHEGRVHACVCAGKRGAGQRTERRGLAGQMGKTKWGAQGVFRGPGAQEGARRARPRARARAGWGCGVQQRPERRGGPALAHRGRGKRARAWARVSWAREERVWGLPGGPPRACARACARSIACVEGARASQPGSTKPRHMAGGWRHSGSPMGGRQVLLLAPRGAGRAACCAGAGGRGRGPAVRGKWHGSAPQ